MTRIALAVAFLSIAGFASASHAAAVAYTAALSGPNESPPNASTGSGTSTILYDAAAHTMRVVVSFSGLSANTTASHIHCCVVAPATTAGVATTTPTFAGFPLGVTSGSYDNTLDLTSASSWNAAFVGAHGGTPAGAEAALAAGLAAGAAYLNIHTTAFPAGEIRGFLVVPPAQPAVSSDIPALSAWSLAALSAALALAGFAAVRRQRA